MRINKFLAQSTGISRRAADIAITRGLVHVNDKPVVTGLQLQSDDVVLFEHKQYIFDDSQVKVLTTVAFHKPVGYVVSRNGQGSRTIYDLLPADMQRLKPVGRLDKESSGLLILTDDGDLANRLTHPRYAKIKIYEASLGRDLAPLHRQMISDHGLQLEDGLSHLQLERMHEGNDRQWLITMHEGRNRQIRRTFAALGYAVTQLHRTRFGDYYLNSIPPGKFQRL